MLSSMKKILPQKVLSFNALFREERSGGFSVSVPHLPGCFSQGDTFEQALSNIKEAIALHLEDESTEISEDEMPVKEFIAPVEVYA